MNWSSPFFETSCTQCTHPVNTAYGVSLGVSLEDLDQTQLWVDQLPGAHRTDGDGEDSELVPLSGPQGLVVKDGYIKDSQPLQDPTYNML